MDHTHDFSPIHPYLTLLPAHLRDMADLSTLELVWRLTDALFDNSITPENALLCPIPLRHPFIFYLGHLPSFTWFTLSKLHNLPPIHPTFDTLFNRGKDPNVDDPSECHPHPAPPACWPTWHEICTYKTAVRTAVRAFVARCSDVPPRTLRLFAEHDLMHLETLRYMLAQAMRPPHFCQPCQPPDLSPAPPPSTEWIRVEGSLVALGNPQPHSFVWDNELDARSVFVPTFHIAKYAVSIADFLVFLRSGGYSNEALWEDADWLCIKREGRTHPATWACFNGNLFVLTGSKLCAASDVSDWPVSVSLAEAKAYARWRGYCVGTEEQWLLGAYGADGASAKPGDIDVCNGNPHSVKEGPESRCGAVGMVGNGWELLDTLLTKFPGFERMVEYPDYSSDFCDHKHFVLKGGSWQTHKLLVRPSFRNFYQARYPYVFSKFRLYRNEYRPK